MTNPIVTDPHVSGVNPTIADHRPPVGVYDLPGLPPVIADRFRVMGVVSANLALELLAGWQDGTLDRPPDMGEGVTRDALSVITRLVGELAFAQLLQAPRDPLPSCGVPDPATLEANVVTQPGTKANTASPVDGPCHAQQPRGPHD